MATFELPAVTTSRLRLRAFRPDDLDAYAAMQANPEVMRHMVMGRTVAHVPPDRAASFIRPGNLASKRVVERLGAVCERTFEQRGSTYEHRVHHRPAEAAS